MYKEDPTLNNLQWLIYHKNPTNQPTRLSYSQQKKRTCRIVDFAVPVDQRVKLKAREKRDEYLDLARELHNYETWKWQWY